MQTQIEEIVVESKYYNDKEYLVDMKTKEIVNEEGEIEGLWNINIPILTDKIKCLDEKQFSIIERFNNGENIFLSGPAGTGKSHLIKVMNMYAKVNKKNIHITALTGCAALLLGCGAKTLHSWAGIGPCNTNPSGLVRRARKRGKVGVWKRTDILVVDEVSMMSKLLFESLDYVGKILRRNDRPFGGIQLVFCGDFYQLPPVRSGYVEDKGEFCFESELWKEIFSETIQLTKIYRQKDSNLTRILNNIRIGVLRTKDIKLLETRIKEYPKKDIKPTILYPKRKPVDEMNEYEHSLLSVDGSQIYKMDVSLVNPKPSQVIQQLVPLSNEPGSIKVNMKFLEENNISRQKLKSVVDFYKKNLVNKSEIELKVGDQVMCTYNINEEIVNGSRGIVTRNYFDGEKWKPIVKFMNGTEISIKPITVNHEDIKGLKFVFMPLTHAWAITIHKCQGTTLDFCVMDVGNGIFECGQTYVALSRVKELSGLYLTEFNPYKIRINRKVKEFYGD